VVNPNGVSVKGSLKGKVGPFHDSVDTAGNGSVGVDLGKNSIGVKINKGKLSSVEVNVGKTSVELGKEDISLVVQGTGVSMERSGKTTLSFDALGLGLAATVDPQRTKGLVNGAVDHMNQAFQMNQMDQQGPVNKK
jgi:hypothetical protein